MADPFAVDFGALATQTADSVSGWIWPITWTIIGVAVLGTIFWYLQYRHKVVIRMLTSQGSVPFEDKAREVMIDGVKFWKLLKRKDVVAIPPKKTIVSLGKDFFGKPKFYVELYWAEEVGYAPAYDTVSTKNFFERITHTEEGGVRRRELGDAYYPLTTQQRALYVHQLEQANARKKKGILDTIRDLAIPIVLVMFMFGVILFWEDIAKPARDMADKNLQMQEANRVLLAQVAEISAQNARIVQAIAGKIEVGELRVQQTVASEGVAG
jgi:hypothetical protein